MKRLLVLRPDRAGDALKTLPGLRAAREACPEWEIDLLASPYNSDIFSFEKGITCHTLSPRWESLSDSALQISIGQLLPKTYDVAVLLPCDPDPQAGRLLRMVSARRRVSRWSVEGEIDAFLHEKRDERENIARLFSTALRTNLSIAQISSRPSIDGHDRDEAANTLPGHRNRIVLCPFASQARRSLSESTAIRLIRQVARRKEVEILLPGIAADYDRFERIRKAASVGKQLKTIYPTSFRALSAYLERCTGLIGVDSGPLHLAIALEMPVLGLLGGCDRKRWYPMEAPQFRFLYRGLFDRFPTSLGLFWQAKRWLDGLTPAEDSVGPLPGPVPVLF